MTWRKQIKIIEHTDMEGLEAAVNQFLTQYSQYSIGDIRLHIDMEMYTALITYLEQIEDDED